MAERGGERGRAHPETRPPAGAAPTVRRRPGYLIALLYAVFAGLSIGVNLGIQALVAELYRGPFAVYVALLIGTGAGLVTKYVLDKRYIFRYVPAGAADDLKRFALYTAVGVLTTAIFWGTELAFHFLIDTEWARYVGGLLGLSVGYTSKYFLDRAFVFGPRRPGR